MTPPIVRLIMQILDIPRELALKILGFIPVRRRLTVSTANPGVLLSGAKVRRVRERIDDYINWGYLQ